MCRRMSQERMGPSPSKRPSMPRLQHVSHMRMQTKSEETSVDPQNLQVVGFVIGVPHGVDVMSPLGRPVNERKAPSPKGED